MRRQTRLLLAAPPCALAVLAGTAGCAPFHAGAAATVGNSRISVGELRSTTERVLAAQPAASAAGNTSQDVVQQQALSELVALAILDQLAPGGVTLTAAEMADGRAAVLQAVAGQSSTGPDAALVAAKGYDLQTQAQLVATVDALGEQTVSGADVTAAYDAEVDHHEYRYDQFVVPASIDVTKVRALLAMPQGLTTIEQQLPQVGGQVSSGSIDGQTLASTIRQKPGPTGYPVGSVIIQAAQPDGSVVLLVATASRVRTLDEALAEGSIERQAALEVRYTAAEKHLGVHVNPRFGAWNPTATDLVGLPLGAVGAGATQLSILLPNSAAGNGSTGTQDPSSTGTTGGSGTTGTAGAGTAGSGPAGG